MLTEPQLEFDDELLSISESSFLQDEKIVTIIKIELF